MVVSDASIHNIMGGMESTAGVRLHNHRRKLKQRFDIIKKLGQGTYGKVQLGINKETGQEVAIKTIKKAKIETEADLVRIRREIQIMSSVQHPNIIHIYEVFENREKMVLVMEYAAGGELYDFLSERKVLAEEEARRIFRQIATAVYYCHKHKICHRDLKLENILLDEHGSAKIADFGLSNVFDEQRLLNTFCGSPLYASPEIVKGTPYHGPEVDCWSLGVLLYTLVYGAMPFDGSNFKRLVKQISQGDYFEPKKPSPASPLIREMLTVTPARRADIEKICSHWWVNEGHTESCLDIAEDLANQTPVRLDLLLSLVPPLPAVGSDKMLLTNEQGGGDSRAIASDQLGPARCHSVGSLMELDQPSAERRIRDFEREKRRGSGGGDAKDAPKRKLEDGISTEDAAHGGAKRKERNRRKDREQSADRKPSTARSSSQSRQASDTEDNRQNVAAAEEKMDVDVDVGLPEPVSSEIPKEINEPPSGSGETLKCETLIALDTAEGCKDDTVTQKTSEKDPIKVTVARDRPTRKSVKGSTKKSKPSSVGSVPSNIETPSTKETEPEVKSTRTEEEGTNVEKNAEETSTSPQVASSESNKTKEGTDEPPVEAVKPKVKKKKKVLNSSKSEDTPIENAQNSTEEVGVIESSLKATEAKSNLDEGSSQETKEAVSKTEVDEDKTEKNSDVSDKISKNSVSSSKDSGENKTVAGVKTKKSRGDLSLGKLGSGTDKAEELASLTKPVERRRSKIFENADKFNIFLGGSDLKSPTTEKPKKVFIPGVKVSDYKQAFERKSSLSSTSLPIPVKNSPSKKTVEQNSKIIPTKNSSCDNVNVDASNIVKSDVEKSLNVTEMVTEFGSSTPKQSDDSQSLKQAETMHELSKHNQSSVESSAPQTNKVNSVDQNTKLNKEGSNEIDMSSEKTTMADTAKDEETDLKLVPALQVTDKVAQQEKARIKKLKDAVEIISNAIAEENKRESDPTAVKKVSSAKPPVPSSPDKLKTKSTGSSNSSPKSPPMSPIDSSSGKKTIRIQIAPNDVRTATVQVSTPQSTNFPFDDSSITKPSAGKGSETSSETKTAEEAIQNEESNNGNKDADTSATTKIETNLDTAGPAKKKSAKVEIILKSATLPRRRTSKAEIQLGFPPSSQPASRLETGAPGEYRTEVEHMVGSTAPSRLQTQRSEVAFPVAAATSVKPLSLRSSSLEPEGTPSSKSKPRERIIPIHFERDTGESSAVSSPPPAKPPVPPVQPQRLVSQRSSSLSRQSTQDSDTDSTISATGPEPIRKSPREYIIPIAVEGGGYVTPRAGSLEPSVSETSTEASRHQHRSSGRFSKPRRMSSLLSDSGASEDEGLNSLNSPFATLQRHSSLGKDDPDDDRPFHHMHRLRSSRPSRRAPLEHNDSLSSAEEEDDDDDGFEILTAESLFSTLLSRVRSLTQRLNVEDGGRPGFAPSRLLSHLASSGHASPTSGFWSNMYGRPGEPLSRRVSENSQFSRPFGHDGESPTPWRRSTSRDVSDGDSVYSETANSMTGGGTLPRGSSRFDCGSAGDDAGSELNSPYYYTPSLARRMQRQDMGSQSTMNQQTQPSDADWLVHKKDYLPPLRKSSLGSLTSQDSNISQPSSRRLARTLSLRSTVDDRSKSSIPRNRDYHSRNSHLFNSSELGQEGKNSFENFTASPHTQDYVPDTEESPRNRTRGDYHPPTCRSLSLLDSKDRSFSTHRGSSALDFGDYTLRSKPLDMERVLPPLPYNAGSQGRRRESGRSSSYARQRSMDMAGSPYGNHLNGSGHRFQHSSIKEEVTQDRPHHSSSLPSMVKTKENKSSYTSKSPERVNRESKVSSNYEVDRHVPKSISSNSSISSHLNNPKFQSADNSNLVVKDGTAGFRSKHQDTSLNKNGTTRSSSEYKGRSQIPSLLRFRSSSVSRDIEKQKKKDLNKNEEVSSSVRKPRLSSSSRSTPDRSILSKFFRPGSEEKEVIREVDSAGEDKDAAKKKRRISRFLRPDFFDTPREESVYAKEKDAKKAAEAESKLKLRKSLRKPVGSHSQDTTDKNLETNSVSVSSDNINTNKDGTDLKNSSKREVAETGEEKETGEQIQLTNEVKEKSNAANCDKKLEKGTPAFEKQSNNSNSKSRFLHSLEKKLEKFRSSGDNIPSASNSSGKSRVDKAIRSLREQSLTPRGVDIITSESHLLKRAVSVSDCCTVESISKNQTPLAKDNAGSKLGNKVTSVLGLFRKLEDTPVKTHQSSPPQPSVLSRLRRTQSVYAGSQSDSVLLNTGADASGSSEFRPVSPLRLKTNNSNSSVKKPIEGAKTIQKESLEAGKKTETYSQNPELKMLENKTIKHTTENILGSEIALDTSNTVQENGNLATKQQESSVPKLVKRGSIKSKTKNTTEAGNKIQPKNATSTGSGAKSASVLVQGKCSENYTNVKSPAQNNTMSVRPHSLNGLKGVIPDNVIKTPEASDMPAVKKLDKATIINESVSLTIEEVATDVKALCPPCENKNKDNLSKNKNDSEKRETAGQDSTNHSADAGKANELESCVSSEISPSTDNAFDNSPVDDFSLNDDEIRFANVKRLDSYPYPADDCSVLSPADESESFDSWSVCSDFESREFPTSPIPPPGDDVEESVGDRIRRKSFYSRFNDIKKKHRKSSLSSIGSLSSSYRDSNSVSFLHHPRNFSRKKDHPLDYVSNSSHSAYHPLQPHRNQSLYAQNDYDDRLVPYSRRSPIPPKSEGNASPLSTEHMARGMNGYADEFSSTDSHQRNSLSVDEDIQQAASTVGESVHFRGGSMEILRLPRHFNHNTNLDTVPNQHIPLYSDSIRRGSDSRLSRSTESNIGATIPKSRLPATWDRHLTLTPRFSSNNIGVAVTSHPDSAVTLGSVAGETLPLHGKYNRYNSNSPLDAPSSIYIGSPTPAGENIWMDSERPVTPH